MQRQAGSEFREVDSKGVLAAIGRLQDDRTFRDARNCFFIEGVRNFVAAADHDFSIETLVYSEKLLTSAVARMLVRRLKRAGVPFVRVSPYQFRGISQAERASGIAAILSRRWTPLESVNPRQFPCWIVLSSVRSPGNLGTLIRTSAALGAGGFILIGDRIDPFHPIVVRATMGALFGQTIVRTSCARFRDWISLHNVQVIGTSPAAPHDFNHFNYPHPTLLMLGDERKGLTEEELNLCSRVVRIPMTAGIDSLNIAIAGSLIISEICKAKATSTPGSPGINDKI